MVNCSETFHNDADSLARALASLLEEIIREALVRRGQAVLALAGGRTPLPIYERLARARLDWTKVTLLATDERWVAHDHPACNTGRLCEIFTATHKPTFGWLTPPQPGPVASAALACDLLRTLRDPFDAVLLGMGLDGHYASVFPTGDLVSATHMSDEVDAFVVEPRPLPIEAPFARVTLSTSRLQRTRRLLLAFTGCAKRAMLERAAQRIDPRMTPISALLCGPDNPLEVHWSD